MLPPQFSLLIDLKKTGRRYSCETGCRMFAKAGGHAPNEAGCHPKTRQGVAVHVCAHKNTVSLLAVSLPSCRHAAYDRLAQRRSVRWSGRWGSNPRQPAWKAGGYNFAARLVYISLTAGFIRFTCNVSVTDKRCRARFLRLSAKHVTCFCQ